jgi:hypothetical protein
MKKIICTLLIAAGFSVALYANPYTNALQRARNVRNQVESVSNPDNHPALNDTKIQQQVQQEVKNVVKECVCPDCKLIYEAKLRFKHGKGKIKYVTPDCPCLKGGKCPVRKTAPKKK